VITWRLSSVVNFSFHHLLWNHWVSLNQALPEWSLNCPLSKSYDKTWKIDRKQSEWVRDLINPRTFIDTIFNPRCSIPSILVIGIGRLTMIDGLFWLSVNTYFVHCQIIAFDVHVCRPKKYLQTFIDTIFNPRCSIPSILVIGITGSEEVDFLIF
jgi:arginine exporter protein ArgO